MKFDVYNMLYSLPAVIIGLTIHEFSHAFMANKLGDTTAKDHGRLTLNPMRHIDIFGLLFLIVAGFGWAKPVQFNPKKMKSPRRDKVLIALAGPVSNLLIGIVFILFIKIFLHIAVYLSEAQYEVILYFLLSIIYINLGLFIFNILPLPPLDGSHIFFSGISISVETQAKYTKYGSYILIIILLIESVFKISILPIGKIVSFIVELFL